jgi:3-oxoacid CoA-transferase subunit B
MDHTNKAGETKLLHKCSLPLTGTGCVDRIITTLGVFDVTEDGLELIELAPDVSVDDITQNTEAKFKLAEGVAA